MYRPTVFLKKKTWGAREKKDLGCKKKKRLGVPMRGSLPKLAYFKPDLMGSRHEKDTIIPRDFFPDFFLDFPQKYEYISENRSSNIPTCKVYWVRAGRSNSFKLPLS